MAKNSRWILVFDFETDSPDYTSCNPTQLAAVPIDPDTLEMKKDEAFNAYIKPPGIDKDEYFEVPKRQATIEWTANNYEITTAEVIEKWKGGMAQKIAWKNFVEYCKKYTVEKKRGQWFPEPIPAGYNITGFDLPIVQRMVDKHKTKNPFSKVNKLDAMDNLFWWFENLEEPADFKMDTWREFFQLKKAEGVAHDALTDVFEEGAIIQRFLKFHRKQASVDKFKGSFKGIDI